MNKNLPKVYANPINKQLNNNKEVFSTEEVRHVNNDNINILSKINEIFANPHHVYKSKVEIRMGNDIINTVIVGKTNSELLTLNGEKIKIKDIDFIERL